jgi:hypothetical protein
MNLFQFGHLGGKIRVKPAKLVKLHKMRSFVVGARVPPADPR